MHLTLKGTWWKGSRVIVQAPVAEGSSCQSSDLWSYSSDTRQSSDMSFFGFGQSAEIDIVLNDAETRKKAEHKTEDGKKDKYFLFYDGETVNGKVNVTLKTPGKRLEHYGIKIEFVGQIGEFVYLCSVNDIDKQCC